MIPRAVWGFPIGLKTRDRLPSPGPSSGQLSLLLVSLAGKPLTLDRLLGAFPPGGGPGAGKWVPQACRPMCPLWLRRQPSTASAAPWGGDHLYRGSHGGEACDQAAVELGGGYAAPIRQARFSPADPAHQLGAAGDFHRGMRCGCGPSAFVFTALQWLRTFPAEQPRNGRRISSVCRSRAPGSCEAPDIFPGRQPCRAFHRSGAPAGCGAAFAAGGHVQCVGPTASTAFGGSQAGCPKPTSRSRQMPSALDSECGQQQGIRGCPAQAKAEGQNRIALLCCATKARPLPCSSGSVTHQQRFRTLPLQQGQKPAARSGGADFQAEDGPIEPRDQASIAEASTTGDEQPTIPEATRSLARVPDPSAPKTAGQVHGLQVRDLNDAAPLPLARAIFLWD